MGKNNYDEVLSEILIQLDQMEQSREKSNKRMDLTIKRMVRAESRLEKGEKRMLLFDKKLEQSLKDQKEFSQMQYKLNRFFIDFIKKNSSNR